MRRPLFAFVLMAGTFSQVFAEDANLASPPLRNTAPSKTAKDDGSPPSSSEASEITPVPKPDEQVREQAPAANPGWTRSSMGFSFLRTESVVRPARSSLLSPFSRSQPAEAEQRVYQGFAHPDFLLPSPQDPNDLQARDINQTSSVRSIELFSTDAAGKSTDAAPSSFTTVQYEFQARPGVFYDVNYSGKGAFSPAQIALDGSSAAHQRGHLGWSTSDATLNAVPFRAAVGAQYADRTADGMGTFQGAYDGISTDGVQILSRSLYGRWLDSTEQTGLLFGKAETYFGDLGSVPSSVMTGVLPIGAVAVNNTAKFNGAVQFRASRYTYDLFQDNDVLESGISVEDQSLLNEGPGGGFNDVLVDYPTTPNRAIVNRYPTVVGRLRYGGPNGFDSFMLGALIRPIDYNDVNYSNHVVTGWGVTANTRFLLGDSPACDAIFAGVVGGQGIGGYIYNGTNAAYTTATSINLLTNFGTYASYRHVWSYTDENDYWASNLFCGFTSGTTATANENRHLTQVGVNLLRTFNSNCSYGLEYDFGSRTTASGNRADDSRVMFVLSLSTGNSKKTTTAAPARSVVDKSDRTLDAPEPAAPPSRAAGLRL